ncbi:hypothetical protein [Leptospira sp. GIMC2001]|uniref:hypothetical protein n=1 Tax=Leptospira sp. GIMC2001 TaxID=1513297 RepID=UPI00234AF3AE|nr:hypothetical protein [Leptospira sp. GIMC2001]WCL49630.1 hypothetical protein O4O04_02090 [Leptospira sp. GIMC2001]
MKQTKSTIVTLHLILMIGFGILHCTGTKNPLNKLSGTYTDVEPYPYGKAFGKRTFTFEKDKWTLDFTLSLDPMGNLKVFSFRTFGNYKMLGESKIIPTAMDAIFYEDKKFLTVHTDNKDLLNAFRFSDCNLVLGQEKDISETGCSGWKSVSICNEDHDIVMMNEKGDIHFGERPLDNDMCSSEKRPIRLTPPVSKVDK